MNHHLKSKSSRAVGQTAAAGVQAGIRRTFPIPPEKAWAFLISTEGRELWLGSGISQLAFTAGETFTTAEGVTGEFRVVQPGRQLRLKWGKAGWSKPSTLQIRLLSNKPDRTTISFHQEHLDHLNTREQMLLHWADVLTVIGERALREEGGDESR